MGKAANYMILLAVPVSSTILGAWLGGPLINAGPYVGLISGIIADCFIIRVYLGRDEKLDGSVAPYVRRDGNRVN